VYLSVNRVGALLWETLADQGASKEELADRLVKAFAIPAERARSDVDTFVEGLKDAGLVEEVE
jgi:hypothetical protein